MAGEQIKDYVVIADDDLDTREGFEMIVGEMLPEAEVVALENGELAATKISEILSDCHHRVILVLSDGRMGGPGKNGTDLYRAVRSIPALQNTPFVMMSGGIDKVDAVFIEQIQKTDANFRFMDKPVEAVALKQTVSVMTNGLDP